jgi:hypothetical protein
VSGQLYAPTAYSRGTGPRDPLDRRLGAPYSRSGQYGEVIFLAIPGL